MSVTSSIPSNYGKRRSKISWFTDINYSAISGGLTRIKFETPLRMTKKALPPPPLSFRTVADSVKHPSKENFTSLTLLQQHDKRKSRNLEKCAFCEELLSVSLPGEAILELSCRDMCHKDCFSIMFDRENVDESPKCNHCGQKTRCVDEFIQTQILHEILLEKRPNVSPDNTPEKQMDRNSLNCSPTECNSQRLSSFVSPSHSYNKKLHDEILKPRITFSGDVDKITLSGEDSYDLNCLLNIKSPQIYTCSQITAKEMSLKTNIIKEIKEHIETNVENWKNHINDQDALGDLLIFDYLCISTNGIEWDQVCCFFFEKLIALVDGHKLIGQILIYRDICSMNIIENGIILNLANETVPELQLSHANPIIILKWESYLNKAIHNKQIDNSSLFQLTTNAWSLIERSKLPEDILRFSELIEKGADIPASYLIHAIPSPAVLPLNLIVSVSLINNSSVDDCEYTEQLISTLTNIRSFLRPFDKLGLIFVGVDGYGNPCKKGSFISCVESAWNGWDTVINDINVFSEPVFIDGFEELQISLEKCKELIPFIRSDSGNVNKLLILNSNNYNSLLPQESKNVDNTINFLIDHLSINLIRIGKTYNEEIQFMNSLISNTQNDSSNSLRLIFGSNLLRFDSFDEFNSSLDYLIKGKYQSICIPEISIQFQKLITTKDIVQISEVEVEGELVPVDDLSKLNIIVSSMTPLTERNIMIKVKLHLENINFDKPTDLANSYLEVPILTYQSKWLNEINDIKTMSTRISQKLSTKQFGLFGNPGAYSPSIVCDHKDHDTYFMDIPLLPPLSSSRDTSFVRRQTELSIIKSLKSAILGPIAESQDILMSSISLAFGMIRGLSFNTEEDFQHDIIDNSTLANTEASSFRLCTKASRLFNNNHDYIQYLVDELQSISSLFNSDSKLASVKCQDLANSLM